MKKIINMPQNFVKETLEGILAAYGDRLRCLDEDARVILANQETPEGKVGIVTAGGSGHLPVFLGYVGKGMLDGCTVGNVFASPSAGKMADMIRACDFGSGVLCLYGNYGGDKMNFQMACEMVDFDGIKTKQVLLCDDVASASAENAEKRRGVAGLVYAYKVAGAAADQMMDLDDVTAIAQKVANNTRTLGFATAPCVVPEAGKPTFTIGENEIEVGMGIHGEPGIEVRGMMTADEVAETALAKITADMPLKSGNEVSVMVNGLGSTPLEELLIVYRAVHKSLTEKGISVFMPHIGEFATSMEMSGLSVTIIKLDAQMKSLLRAPGSTPFYTSENK